VSPRAFAQVEGFKELEEALLDLGEVGAEKTARAALRKAMEPVLAEAQRLVKKRTGLLYDALAITTRGYNGKGAITGAIATAGLMIRSVKGGIKGVLPHGTHNVRGRAPDPRRYWHLVEFGTSRTSPKPFIRPAFDGQLDAMLDRLRAQLKAKLERRRRR
jgi:HK97 gp10 family phage protein